MNAALKGHGLRCVRENRAAAGAALPCGHTHPGLTTRAHFIPPLRGCIMARKIADAKSELAFWPLEIYRILSVANSRRCSRNAAR